jgi:hypothetical protein
LKIFFSGDYYLDIGRETGLETGLDTGLEPGLETTLDPAALFYHINY